MLSNQYKNTAFLQTADHRTATLQLLNFGTMNEEESKLLQCDKVFLIFSRLISLRILMADF